jgi:GMP synthase (glutamine-hydrolysing)
MPSRVLLVVHQKLSDPGRVARELHRMGYETDVRRPSSGDPLPETMDDHAGAVIFGGPMSANDDTDFIRAELAWIPTVLDSGKPFLGICLGGQMLSRVLGGRVGAHADNRCEVGFHPLVPTESGRRFMDWPSHFYQWHGEGMSLPASAELLASSERFDVQAFRYGRAIGVQFHPEVTGAIMRRWVGAAVHRWEIRPGGQSAAEQFAAQRRFEPGIVRWTRDFLGRWISGGQLGP